jgi:hypothetical protein
MAQARKVWEESVGKDVYFCNFKVAPICANDELARWAYAARLTAVKRFPVVQSFYKHVLREETDLADKDFKRYMKYFLNFPKDDTVSVAKYASLVP